LIPLNEKAVLCLLAKKIDWKHHILAVMDGASSRMTSSVVAAVLQQSKVCCMSVLLAWPMAVHNSHFVGSSSKRMSSLLVTLDEKFKAMHVPNILEPNSILEQTQPEMFNKKAPFATSLGKKSLSVSQTHLQQKTVSCMSKTSVITKQSWAHQLLLMNFNCKCNKRLLK